MLELILGILGPILQMTAMIVGDHLLAKWIGAVKFWWETRVDDRFKKMCDEEHDTYSKAWKDFQKDREWKDFQNDRK